MSHTCHAHGCTRVIPPRMFCCGPHWKALSLKLRQAIWREYRDGQEKSKDPSARYMAVQRRAIAELAFRPNDEQAALVAAEYLARSERWRRIAIQRGEGDPFE